MVEEFKEEEYLKNQLVIDQEEGLQIDTDRPMMDYAFRK
jgi:hypothetical protein